MSTTEAAQPLATQKELRSSDAATTTTMVDAARRMDAGADATDEVESSGGTVTVDTASAAASALSALSKAGRQPAPTPSSDDDNNNNGDDDNDSMDDDVDDRDRNRDRNVDFESAHGTPAAQQQQSANGGMPWMCQSSQNVRRPLIDPVLRPCCVVVLAAPRRHGQRPVGGVGRPARCPGSRAAQSAADGGACELDRPAHLRQRRRDVRAAWAARAGPSRRACQRPWRPAEYAQAEHRLLHQRFCARLDSPTPALDPRVSLVQPVCARALADYAAATLPDHQVQERPGRTCPHCGHWTLGLEAWTDC